MELSPWYFATKLAAYVMWMFVGLSIFRPRQSQRIPLSLALGTLRVLMGFGFGVVIWLAGTLVFIRIRELDTPSTGGLLGASVVTYLSVYVPVRWVEWGIFELALDRRGRSLKAFLLSSGVKARGWRLGGIVISCLADIPVIMSVGGLPLGRFTC
jgi:hypothetical protein